MALNDLYRKAFYGLESEFWTDRRTDDWAQRDYVYELMNGSATSVHRHATKSDNDDRLSTKLHFFLPPANYFRMIEAVLIFFVTL